MSESKFYFVPMRVTYDETWYIEADSEAEAIAKANSCEIEDHDPGEMIDWEVRGKAELQDDD